MVHCEICGRQFKNTQGLRGHKTFFHGIRANRSKLTTLLDRLGLADETKNEVRSDNSRLIEGDKELRDIVSRVAKIEHIIAELKETLEKLENYMALLATRNETCHIASDMRIIKGQVYKHDRWFNPRGLHEAVVGLNGGPIAYIEKRLQRRQSFTK